MHAGDSHGPDSSQSNQPSNCTEQSRDLEEGFFSDSGAMKPSDMDRSDDRILYDWLVEAHSFSNSSHSANSNNDEEDNSANNESVSSPEGDNTRAKRSSSSCATATTTSSTVVSSSLRESSHHTQSISAHNATKSSHSVMEPPEPLVPSPTNANHFNSDRFQMQQPMIPGETTVGAHVNRRHVVEERDDFDRFEGLVLPSSKLAPGSSATRAATKDGHHAGTQGQGTRNGHSNDSPFFPTSLALNTSLSPASLSGRRAVEASVFHPGDMIPTASFSPSPRFDTFSNPSMALGSSSTSITNPWLVQQHQRPLIALQQHQQSAKSRVKRKRVARSGSSSSTASSHDSKYSSSHEQEDCEDGDDEADGKRKKENRGPTSLQIFESYVQETADENGNKTFDTSRILSRECFEEWVASRKVRPKKPEEAFRKALISYITVADGASKPFSEPVEESLLQHLRKRQVWPCFAGRVHEDSGRPILIGSNGIRAKGFHEAKREGDGNQDGTSKKKGNRRPKGEKKKETKEEPAWVATSFAQWAPMLGAGGPPGPHFQMHVAPSSSNSSSSSSASSPSSHFSVPYAMTLASPTDPSYHHPTGAFAVQNVYPMSPGVSNPLGDQQQMLQQQIFHQQLLHQQLQQQQQQLQQQQAWAGDSEGSSDTSE